MMEEISDRDNFTMDEQNMAFEEARFNAILFRKQLKKEQNQKSKEKAIKLTRQIPMQLLALEWFNQIDPSTEMRAYLIENFLPILVLGCEKVLNEAQAQDLIEKNQKNDNFNPINYLSQFLMRNNPKYNNQNETSAYVKTIRELYQDLRDQMFLIQGNRLAKVKEEVRRKRNERKNEENFKKIEVQRRKLQIEKLFHRFYLDENGRLELAILNEIIKVFNYQATNYSNHSKSIQIKLDDRLPKYCFAKDTINFRRRLLQNEFVECVSLLSENLKSELFDLYVELMEECAVLIVNLAKANILDNISQELVKLIDTTKSGLLSRKRVVQVLKHYFDKNKRLNLNEPFAWPVLDPTIKYENKLDTNKNRASLSKQGSFLSLSEAVRTKVSPKSSVDMINRSFNEDKKSETDYNNGNLDTKKSSQADISDALIDEVENKTITIADQPTIIPSESAKNSLNGIETTKKHSISSSSVGHKLSIDLSVKSDHHELQQIKADISKETELQFLKDGELYYHPLKEPLHAFDSSLLLEKSHSLSNDESLNENDLQFEFDTQFVNPKQFSNLILNFITKNLLDSDIYINDLIMFVKENYSETVMEKNEKLRKLNVVKQMLRKKKKFEPVFEKIDNEGSGTLELNYLVNSLNNFKMGLFKEQISHIKSDLFQTHPNEAYNLSKDDFLNFMNSLLMQLSSSDSSSIALFEEQLISYLFGLTQIDLKEKARGESRKLWLAQIKYVGDVCLGSFEPLYKQLFLTLLKDAENHGNYKMLSAYVGILEKSPLDDKTSEIVLRYHASTPNDSKYILGKVLTRSSNNVSFEAIDNGCYQHIRNVRLNPNVFFFNPDNKNDGSLLIYPLKFVKNNVFGIIGIDTLQQTGVNASTFSDNELKFYQGLATAFSQSYINLIYKNRLLKCCSSAIEWLYKTCNKQINSINVYFVQVLDPKIHLDFDISTASCVDSESSVNIKQVMKYDFKGDQGEFKNRIDEENFIDVANYLGSKLYDCAILSETTVSYFNGNVSYFVPFRNQEQKTIFVMEIVQKEKLEITENYENQPNDILQLDQIESVLHVVYKCQKNLIDEHFFGQTYSDNIFEYEIIFEEEKFAILFEKCFISHVLNKLSKHLNQKFEISSSDLLSNLIQIISDLINNKNLREFELIDESVLHSLKSLDPTKQENETDIFEKISRYNISINDLIEFYRTSYVLDPLKSLIEWFLLVVDMKSRKESLKSNIES